MTEQEKRAQLRKDMETAVDEERLMELVNAAIYWSLADDTGSVGCGL